MAKVSKQLENLFIGYYDKMFGNKPLTAMDKSTHVLNGMLKKIIAPINYSCRLTFLEQNPHKPSTFGKRANNGAKIMWVIVNKDKKERWLGRVEGRVWYAK